MKNSVSQVGFGIGDKLVDGVGDVIFLKFKKIATQQHLSQVRKPSSGVPIGIVASYFPSIKAIIMAILTNGEIMCHSQRI